MAENLTAVERIEEIRLRVEAGDILFGAEAVKHLLRMYDESKRVNVGLIVENKELRKKLGAGDNMTSATRQTDVREPDER